MYAQYGLSKSRLSNVSSKDFKDIKGETPWLDQYASSEVLPEHDFFKQMSPEHQKALLDWSTNGYAVLENYLSEEDVDSINDSIDHIIEEGNPNWRSGKKKLMFAINQDEKLRATAAPQRLNDLMSMLLGKKAKLFQSINFIEGSEQKAHSDSIHMTTFPLGYLTAIWIALEDIEIDQGALFYYPGSHQLPYVLNDDFDHGGNFFFLGKNTHKAYEGAIQTVINDHQLERKTFKAKKGDALIWHANLLHGGLPITREGATRKSMVMHFYAEDVICYHEITQRPTIFEDH